MVYHMIYDISHDIWHIVKIRDNMTYLKHKLGGRWALWYFLHISDQFQAKFPFKTNVSQNFRRRGKDIMIKKSWVQEFFYFALSFSLLMSVAPDFVSDSFDMSHLTWLTQNFAVIDFPRYTVFTRIKLFSGFVYATELLLKFT